MLSPYDVVVLASSAACLIIFCYIIYKLLKVHMKLQAKSLLYLSSSFMLLAISQIFSILSIIVELARLSLTFYVATSSFAAAAFLLMVISVYQEKKVAFAFFPIVMLIPDSLACILAAMASIVCQGRQLKAYLLALSTIHFIRIFSTMLIFMDLGALLLALAEVSRALTTLLFAIFHVNRVMNRE